MALAKHSTTPAQINRRALIGAVPAFGFSLAAVQAGAEPADPHPEWLIQWRDIRRQWHAALDEHEDDTEASEALWARRSEIAKLISGTAAKTDTGRMAQVQWVLEDADGDFDQQHGAALATLRDSFAA